jgi:hypothetical protein
LAAANPTPANDEVTVFVGLDLLVGPAELAQPIRRVEGGRALIRSGDDIQSVPIRQLSDLQVKRAAKVGRRALTVSSFNVSRAYTVHSDPALAEMANQSRLTGLAMDMRDLAERQLINAQTPDSIPRDSPNYEETVKEATARYQAVQVQYHQTRQLAERLSDTRLLSSRVQEADADARFDAISVSFRVASTELIPEAYVIFIAEVFDPIQPAHPRTFVHVRDIGSIEPDPKTVRIFHSGLPPGYEVLKTRLHVYSHGQELGSNLSEKSISLTPSELREYLTVEHLAAHVGDTLPPVPVWGTAPAGFLSSVRHEDAQKPIAIEVDAEGRVLSLRADDLPPYIREGLLSLYFRPALNNGHPVPGHIAATLAELMP